jgi:hypothetical protein
MQLASWRPMREVRAPPSLASVTARHITGTASATASSGAR